MKILIVEDETIVSLDIKNALIKLGYEITNRVTNCDDAVSSVIENKPDLIFMDINLKNSKDGIETAEVILKVQYIPIIYLTAYSDEDTISRAIKTDPVGYVIKPFKREDLHIAVKLGIAKSNLHKNTIPLKQTNLHLGNQYYFDIENDMVHYQNISLNLGSKELHLLKILVYAKGNVVSFKQLEYDIWGENPISSSTLRTLLYRLRTRFDHQLIENVYSLGCRLVLPE
jgi:DNA-binding response OmpR family regulator